MILDIHINLQLRNSGCSFESAVLPKGNRASLRFIEHPLVMGGKCYDFPRQEVLFHIVEGIFMNKRMGDFV